MGLFRPRPTTRSHFRRATLGTLLFSSGIVCGVFVAIPKLHQSMSVDQEVVEMSCAELVRGGLTTSSMVLLRDASVHAPGEIDSTGLTASETPGLAQLASVMAHPKAKTVTDQLVRGNVLPRGAVQRGVHQPLKLSHGREVAQYAETEVSKTGRLLVHVTPDPTAKLITQGAEKLNLTLPPQFVDAASIDAYTLQPVGLVDSKQNALIWVGGSLLALTLGWILCGGAGWGWWIILSPIGAIIGLPGLPIRSGRGNRLTWLVSFLVGGAAIAAGVHLAVQRGELGGVQGNWMWQSAGLLSASFGLAALLGTFISIRSGRRRALTLDALGKKPAKTSRSTSKEREAMKKAPEQPIALQAAIAKPAYARRYLDPRLSVSSKTDVTGDIAEQTASLEKHEFESPLIIELSRGDSTCDATVQVGCRNLILAMTDQLDGALRLRMISILEDGHVVVTVNEGFDCLPGDLSDDTTTARVMKTNQAKKMLSKHLETSATVAEKRSTGLVVLENMEWRDVLLYSERCLADTSHHAGIQKWEIPETSYGRFQYPPQRVAVVEMA